MNNILLISLSSMLLMSACSHDSSPSIGPSSTSFTQPTGSPTTSSPTHAAGWLKELLAKPFFYGTRGALATVNGLPSNYYGKAVPKATIVADYNSENPKIIFLTVYFPYDSAKNLPPSLHAELNKRNLLNPDTLEIAWVVQERNYIGANVIGATSDISYLKGHGWADPDGPGDSKSQRLLRDFLYGIFESDADISYEVKNDQMLPFSINAHHGAYSPQTAALHLPDPNTSIAFWSLVIDHLAPSGTPRAIATLHWLLSESDMTSLNKEVAHTGTPIKNTDGTVAKMYGEIRYNHFGEFIDFLQNKSSLKKSSLMEKLNKLLND